MVHPVLEEILRAKLPLRQDVLQRWQRLIRYEVIPAIAQADARPAKSTRKAAEEATA